MPSFEFADCPTRLDLEETTQGNEHVQKGTLTLTVRNRTERARTGRITIETEGAAKPEWFSFEGSLPTSPREIERDFAAKGTETIRAVLQVPTGGTPGGHVFRVRVTAEDDPDNDFTVGPNVAFDVAALAPPTQPRSYYPLWAIIGGIVAMLLLVGAGVYVWLQPHGPAMPTIIGLSWSEAKPHLDNAGIEVENPVYVISETLPPSRYATRVLAVEPGECKRTERNTKVNVYLGARNDPFFCRSCNNRRLESLDAAMQERVRAGAILTTTRYFGVVLSTRDLPPCP